MTSPSSSNSPLDALLASYAVGAISRPLHALVASHLVLKPENRMFVATLEGVASDSMEASMPGAVINRESRLNDIFGNFPASVVSAREDEFIPTPLKKYLAQDYEALPWKSVMPGLKEVKLEDQAGLEASMLWIKAGRAMPAHTHPGIEATLVLQGSFSDKTGHFERGDISVVDSDMNHKPVAGEGDDCICFAVSEGPVRLTGKLARIFQRLVRH